MPWSPWRARALGPSDRNRSMSEPAGTITTALKTLFRLGLRYKTVIDVGCADGQFSLIHRPFLGDAAPVNIDAQAVYEPSLAAIREVLGGYYFIGAVGDREGEIELTEGAHPYWTSTRPRDNEYWQRHNQLHAGKIRVPATTLDALAMRWSLEAPFLLKLDIQGGELAALRGAAAILPHTDAVLCEADMADFHVLHAVLDQAGFGLFDVTELCRLEDTSLGWFYPVYLNRRHDGLRAKTIWDAARNDEVIRLQQQRRERVLAQNARLLEHYRALAAERRD
jgi:FkbM family methyltransferase